MNKLIPLFTLALFILSTACSGGSKCSGGEKSTNDSIANDTAVDSISLVLNRLDGIVFITLRKDCGGEYYYSW